VTSQHGESLPGESARPASPLPARITGWAPWLVVGCYVLGAFALTWRLWADPAGQMVAGNSGDINLFAWFMRDIATAVSHGRLPALVTTGLNAPQGINLMWNTSVLLPGLVLAPGAHVLVIPDLYYALRWQAETGVPGSMVGGGDFIEPDQAGKATSYIYNRLSTAVYLTNLWQGTLSGRAPSQSKIGKDLAYWQLSAIVTVAGRNSRLARFLTGEFGRPAVQVDDVLAWRIPPGRPLPGKLSARRRDMWPDGRDDRHNWRGRFPWLASVGTAAGRRVLGGLP
jgi:hypothetical protein